MTDETSRTGTSGQPDDDELMKAETEEQRQEVMKARSEERRPELMDADSEEKDA